MNVFDYLNFVLAPQLLNGLTFGIALVLVALGLTIIFGLLDVLNLGHGEFYAFGAFSVIALAGAGVNFWVILVMAPVLMIPLAVLVERTLIRPVYSGGDRHVSTLLVTFGLSLVMEDVLKLAFGPNSHRPENPLPGASSLFGIVMPNYRIFLCVLGIVLILVVAWIVYRTRFGSMVRAAAFDSKMAASLGVPVSVVYSATFALGAGLAAIAGVLLAPIYSVFPTMGRDFILMAFSVVIIGGMGSIAGAVFAGILLALVGSLASLVIPPVWAETLVFAVMVVFLMLRPQGLFGRIGHA
ncbi:branched-chain amino acid ABC transporter permease [Noviherbaspirillum denitrificans]|uniref:ABC transporter permease n=1 Tax=Noviherbaspirillum denitrificans TaxID=1968433 RepID=A0A254T811_9BURK|nr:branched-chain amino acid ABC transporter permease [Noviherbaspirillum denitrificans]OWW18715.1 ABC transporter permease [Noviherbaspirillum denitrificans]